MEETSSFAQIDQKDIDGIGITVLKSRKRNGVTQYLINFDGDDEKKAQWIKENDPKFKHIIEEFEDTLKDKKKSSRKSNPSTPRRISKIAGVMEIDKEKWFIVRFTDSELFEKVSHSDMKNRYTKSLLAFYEQHIVIKPDNETDPSQNKTEPA